jgi:hypothetical protein
MPSCALHHYQTVPWQRYAHFKRRSMVAWRLERQHGVGEKIQSNQTLAPKPASKQAFEPTSGSRSHRHVPGIVPVRNNRGSQLRAIVQMALFNWVKSLASISIRIDSLELLLQIYLKTFKLLHALHQGL